MFSSANETQSNHEKRIYRVKTMNTVAQFILLNNEKDSNRRLYSLDVKSHINKTNI